MQRRGVDIHGNTNGNDVVMTENSEATPPPKGRSRLGVAISWFFIIAAVALMQIPQFQKTKVKRDAQDLLLQLQGKYIVGYKHLFEGNPALSGNIGTIKQQLQKYRDAQSRLLLIPITAELSGKEAAIEELEQIALDANENTIKNDTSLFLQLYEDGASSLSPQQHQTMKKFGWLGQLALNQGEPDTNLERKAILHSALCAFFLVALLVIGILAALFAGIILLIIAIVLRAKGRLSRRLALPLNPGTSLLEGFAIYLTGFGTLPLLMQRFMPESRPGALALAGFAVVVGTLWPHFRGANWKDWRAAIGWHRGQGFFREIGAGIIGYIAGLPLLAIAFVVVGKISQYAGKMPVHPLVYEINRSPYYMLLWTLMACVWAPVVEETLFRGALFGYLRRRLPWALSGILSALVFAAVHPQGWIAIPLLATIGFILSAIREWRGSLIASMSAHALNNAFAVLVLIFIMN
jgi:membrane protease YdiL (CAAX protease family)